MANKVCAWKPEANENVRFSTVNIVVYQSHMLWPYNSSIEIMQWFIIIDILEISQI